MRACVCVYVCVWGKEACTCVFEPNKETTRASLDPFIPLYIYLQHTLVQVYSTLAARAAAILGCDRAVVFQLDPTTGAILHEHADNAAAAASSPQQVGMNEGSGMIRSMA